MFGLAFRRRTYTLCAIIALAAVAVMFAIMAGWSSDHHASSLREPMTIQDQLRQRGYTLVETTRTNSSDAHRAIDGEVWKVRDDHAQPVVFLTDYPGKPGTFFPAGVEYGTTGGYDRFWCVPSALTGTTSLTAILNDSYQTRQDVKTGARLPAPSDIPGTAVVTSNVLCYMK